MEIFSKPCGLYQTNCYVIRKNGYDLIIDPGEGAYEFVILKAKKPIAILLTHGHFDHIFSAVGLKKFFNIPIYIHKDDKFMIERRLFGYNYETTCDAVGVGVAKFDDVQLDIGEFDVEFMHFAGHTPGCCMVRVDETIFSGDFLFEGSIGRWDFPYSNADDMRQSIIKCMNLKGDFTLYPGHGDSTTLSAERENLPFWLNRVR